MPVSPIKIVRASPKLIGAKLQRSNFMKEHPIKINSDSHFVIAAVKEIVINGSLKAEVFSNIFALEFIYLQELISTKVMKVNHGYDSPFYKVVLTTQLHNSAGLWWLQFQPDGWVTLLGPKLDQKLHCAITSAIEHHELLVAQ